MSAKTTPQTRLSVLLEMASPEVMAIVRKRLTAKPNKLALLILKELNPHEVLSQGEECELRAVSEKTLRAMKARNEIPPVL